MHSVDAVTSSIIQVLVNEVFDLQTVFTTASCSPRCDVG